MDDRLGGLTHKESLGVLKDLFERLASNRGGLWYQAIKHFLVGTSTEFYMLEVGNSGCIRNLMESFTHAGFSISPMGGNAEKALRASNPKPVFGLRECFRMLAVRAMDFGSTKFVQHETMESTIRHIGLQEGCVATSWEAACNLLLETEKKREDWVRRNRLLGLSPSPIVWTFVGGDHENRWSFAKKDGNRRAPLLVGLVSRDADFGFKGIVEAECLQRLLGREPGTILPSDVFVFSIKVDRG